MRIERSDLEKIVYSARGWGRFTQDSPIMPDVWFGYGQDPAAPLDLLLQPYRGVSAGELATALRKSLESSATGQGRPLDHAVAYDERNVVVRLTLAELIRFAIPLTKWWKKYTGTIGGLGASKISALIRRKAPLGAPHGSDASRPATGHGAWFMQLAGALLSAGARKGRGKVSKTPSASDCSRAIAPLLAGLTHDRQTPPLLWSVNRNREARISVWDSRKTTKADVAQHMFSLDTSHLAWAIFDTGIDARHTAFRRRDAEGEPRRYEDGDDFSKLTRVRKTYDFTRIRSMVRGAPNEAVAEMGGVAEFRRRLRAGRAIDWELLEPLLEIPHDEDYVPPVHPHGTHVAGILAADWRRKDPGYEADDENDMRGMCADITLHDFRVLDAKGEGDEFGVLAALQFARYLNRRSNTPLIHGANLSLSIPHDVSNYACGRTPVCDEAERLQASGVVVVAAAGNEGYVHYLVKGGGESDAYRNISITDPGNAESVLTVGATHGRKPHTYGVSYFSSRGPTGDGRVKPDLVAPGEKIKGPAPGESYERLDGTSMAAPHVSGAAAMLMSRHPEFIGDPERVKQILCSTATDLGRERYFQGAGLVDVCRAIQSV